MQTRTKVVARGRDGSVIKGYTFDFTPTKERFHITAPDDKQVVEVASPDLKAVFYVRSFEGDRERVKPKDLSEKSLEGIPGVKLKVTFQDGEVMYGSTLAYAPGRRGFFITPVDAKSNNERAYVFADSTRNVDNWR
jgi:hypothetical protein